MSVGRVQTALCPSPVIRYGCADTCNHGTWESMLPKHCPAVRVTPTLPNQIFSPQPNWIDSMPCKIHHPPKVIQMSIGICMEQQWTQPRHKLLTLAAVK